MWEKRPVLLLLLATATILIGTIITVVLPFAWVNTEADAIAEVKPYTAIELEGRDIYVREGCNNCHSQLIRPLEPDVMRYGPYSRSGEFVYDRPFLWGSRRGGPDLARLGGKYSDSWHYKHMVDPRSMVPETNMPEYSWLNDAKVDAAFVVRKMDVLGFPYTQGDIKALEGKTEMDAMVAYLQKLGIDLPRTGKAADRAKGLRKADVNPLAGDPAAIAEGKDIYSSNCAGCHGADRKGVIGPELAPGDFDDDELFDTIAGGRPDDGMPGFSRLGRDRIWKLVAYLQKEGTDLPRTEKTADKAKVLRKADVNPLAGDPAAIAEGKDIYSGNCAGCHGADRGGVIGPELAPGDFDDDELFDTIAGGRPDDGMPGFSRLGRDRIWKLVAFLQAE